MHENQSTIVRWQAIINDDLRPFPILPEVEAKYASITVALNSESLVWRHDSVEQLWELT